MDSLFLKASEFRKLPEKSGVYRFYDIDKTLIYIGKAKNLRSRVSSYFINNNKSVKTLNLVKNIEYINFTVVNNEHEAFLLENNLIKEFGSMNLLNAIKSVKPKFVFCGHIHGGNHEKVILKHNDGQETILYNVSIKDEDYKPTFQPLEIEVL